MMSGQAYIGTELEIFAKAQNWKRYFKSVISPNVGNRVLEVGAGIGATTSVLCDGTQSEWVCLEPDPALLDEVRAKIESGELPSCCTPKVGTVQSLTDDELFDSIIYIDVLEHIEFDAQELEAASHHLKRGGKLIVLSPAWQFLYSPFDKQIGHFRRYTKEAIRKITPASMRIVLLKYLDAVGLFTSLANRIFLRQSMPTQEQILFWDRNLVPLSRFVDRMVNYAFGRSIVSIWERVDE
jgi:2-polyprenyl-3-methyl-5-hydroxy-6-metoxy-1,4-benzoquinol methylase